MKKQRGYAIPLSLCVAGVTLMLGLSAAQMSAGDLAVANHLYHQERARQMAEYGLERCVVEEVPSGTLLGWKSVSNTHPEDHVRVRVFSPGAADSPVVVPTGCEYWVSEGTAGQGSRTLASARIGAMVRYGRPVGSAGAQIRYLTVGAENGERVTFKAIDGETRQEVPDEVVCSTEASSLAADAPPFVTTPVTLNRVDDFRGKVRIPQGANEAIVSYDMDPGKTVAVTQDGGPLNVPEYSPPGGLAYFSTLTVTEPVDLVPGRYGTLRMTPQAVARLNGVYHIERLELTGDSGNPRLQVPADGSAKVFVNEISQGGRALEIQNRQHTASDFRLTFKEKAASSTTPIALTMIEGGEAAIVAAGRILELTSDSHRRIQGSFSSFALKAHFPVGNGAPPEFVYDLSGTTARRPRGADGGIVNDVDLDPAATPRPTDPDGGDGTGYSNGDNGNGNGNSGNTGNGGNSGIPESGGGTGGPRPRTHSKRPPGTEPMILSRQSL